jgi:Protein of unknown function (DUF2501)
MKTVLAGIALTLAVAAPVASAGQLDKLMGGSSTSSLTSGSMGNAAGILQYCVTNNYLGGNSGASGVKDQLLGKLGGTSSSTTAPTQDPGYLDGAKGLLKSKDGKTLDLGGASGSDSSPMGDMKAKMTKKACDVVLKQGKSMLGGMGK